jgi:hypothetical protein
LNQQNFCFTQLYGGKFFAENQYYTIKNRKEADIEYQPPNLYSYDEPKTLFKAIGYLSVY